jgi:phosphoenolpyruvate carboxykinase (ATP)
MKRLLNTLRVLSQDRLAGHGIHNRLAYRNLSPAQIYEVSVNRVPAHADTGKTVISSAGALVSYSGERTGRSPADKRIVCDEITENEVWWGDVNMKMTPQKFRELEELAQNYLSSKDRIYVVDGYIGADPKYRKKVRIICTRAYHALFMHNMLIRPTLHELENDFEEVDFVVYNAGESYAPRGTTGTYSRTAISIDLTNGKAVIFGTQYAGCMKKGLFTVMNYIMPKKGYPSLHTSCTEGIEKKDTTLMFGLSGTGKTTLSADPKRLMVGDDEHVWTDDGVFNIEGGCYAKVVGLTKEKEPDIYNAIRFGAVLENVRFKDQTNRIVDYENTEITENTRCCFPVEFLPNAKIPSVSGHPQNVIFLTCDAAGVLPPVSRLTPDQASYHFISGYTAKVAGTEMGVNDPEATFSACFGAAFLPLHPMKYAKLLAEKVSKHKSNVWLVNTGWVNGKYGEGDVIFFVLKQIENLFEKYESYP